MIAAAIYLTFLLLFFAAEAFFSGSEIVFLSANRPKLFRKAKDNAPGAVLAKRLLSTPETLFSTTVVGTTVSICCSSTLTALFLIQTFGTHHQWLPLVVLTPAILILAEFTPKLYGRANSDTLILKLARPIQLASIILYPFTRTFGIYAQVLKRVLGESPEKGFFLSREELKAALPASRGSDVTHAERALIERILESSRITAKEILRPLIDVVAIEQNQTLEEAIRLISESEHSRLPVYDERIDKIVGVFLAYRCLNAGDLQVPVKTVMDPAFFVPESKPLDELLLDLKTRPMAIAVNEYGGAEGILTMEDVMEEIVGEIEDEFDEPERLYRRIGENAYIVNARMECDDIINTLHIPIPHDDAYQTLAGFLLMRMQKIPRKWDSILIDNVEYVIQSATDRSIEEVYIIFHERN